MTTHVIPTDVTVRTWAILTEASAAASVAVVPYLLSVQRDALAAANARRVAGSKRPIAPAKLAALAAVQGQVTFGIAAGLGLRSARMMGLGLPHLDNVLSGKHRAHPPAQRHRRGHVRLSVLEEGPGGGHGRAWHSRRRHARWRAARAKAAGVIGSPYRRLPMMKWRSSPGFSSGACVESR
jgi:hypothetical protein